MLYNDDIKNILPQLINKGTQVDAIITDPPYGILKKHKIETNIDIDMFIKQSYELLKDNSFFVFFGAQPTFSIWINKALKQGFNFKQEIIWHKGNRNSPFNDFGKIHENIAVFVKGKKQFNKVTGSYTDIKESLAEFTESKTILRNLDTAIKILTDKELLKRCLDFDEDPYKYYIQNRPINETVTLDGSIKNCDRYFNTYKTLTQGTLFQSVMSFKSGNLKGFGNKSENYKHPTVKPVDLLEVLIKLTTNKGDTVLDPFVGSGTTGVACKETERNFIGIELYKEYFEMAKNRINKYQLQEKLFTEGES